MRKAVLAAILAVASVQGASAADRRCYSPVDMEAEQAIVFQTNLMVISSACRDEVYGEFRARNSSAIIRYQRIMIAHFRREGARNAQNEFDSWNTSLANEIALKQGAEPTVQVCQRAATSRRWPAPSTREVCTNTQSPRRRAPLIRAEVRPVAPTALPPLSQGLAAIAACRADRRPTEPP